MTRRAHLWLSPDDRAARDHQVHVRPVLLTRAHLAGEIDTSALAHVIVSGWLMQCRYCGALGLRGRFVDDHGDVREVALYGLDVDAMAPMREPACLDLVRPRPLDEDDDDNAGRAHAEACA